MYGIAEGVPFLRIVGPSRQTVGDSEHSMVVYKSHTEANKVGESDLEEN